MSRNKRYKTGALMDLFLAHGIASGASMASELAVSRQVISNYWRGHDVPPDAMCHRIAGVLGVPVGEVKMAAVKDWATGSHHQRALRYAQETHLDVLCFTVQNEVSEGVSE